METRKKNQPLKPLKQFIEETPEKFPVYYQNLNVHRLKKREEQEEQEVIRPRCSAYKSQWYFTFMHHSPISKM